MQYNLPKYDQDKVIELFGVLGYSLWMIQSLELALNNYLVLVHKISIDTAKAQVQQIFDQTSKKTFGQLLADLKNKDEYLPKVIIKKLEDILQERNWLVHKVYSINQGNMFSRTKTDKLIAKIIGIGDEANELSKLVVQKTEEVTINKGFYTEEELDKWTKDILNSWTKD